MSQDLNKRMLQVQKDIAKLDKSAEGDYDFWKGLIASGENVEAHELTEAESYLNVLLEGLNDK